MILRATLSITILLLTIAPAPAHVPAGRVLGIWQWPLEALPVMDGDLSEWEVVPDSLWLDLSTLDADGNPLFWAAAGGEAGRPGTEADPADLAVRVAVGWNDEHDRLYFAQERHDDVYDRDGAEPPVTCGGDDAVEIFLDADHGGERAISEYERGATGRDVQIGLWRWPPIGDMAHAWNWMWTSSATWHDKEPYSCCPGSYILEGEHGTEVTLTTEWWSVYFNTLVHESPEESLVAPLSEGQIIGMAVSICDIDEPDSQGHNTIWTTPISYSHWEGLSEIVSDWLLLPPDDYWTGVERTSWGQVKASFTP